MCEVWLAARHLASAEAKCALDHPEVQAWSPDERQRLNAITAPRRHAQFVVGHGLLRELLKTSPIASLVSDSEELLFRPHRAPALSGPTPALKLGLSHSGEWIVAAASRSLVGLDLECLKPRPRWRELALTVCPELFHHNEPTMEDFYRAWTLKEAWLKAHEQSATIGHLQALRVRQRTDADACGTRTWQFEHGVVSCWAPHMALFHWPMGQPPALNLQRSAEWVVDDHGH